MSPSPVDVVLVTALADEFKQVQAVTTGLLDPGWVEEDGPGGVFVIRGCFARAGGEPPLTVVATFSPRMGGEYVSVFASSILSHYRPTSLAMSGICGGRRGDVNLGDVIFAERMWNFEAGKTVSETDALGRSVERFQGDPVQYTLDAHWHQRLEGLRVAGWPRVADAGWLAERPALPLEHQESWILLRCLDGDNPRNHPDRPTRCPDWLAVIQRLRGPRGWLDPADWTLTPEGRRHVQELLDLYPDGLPEPDPFKIHVGPIATGSRVVQDPGIFQRLAVSMRKVIGLEMEISAMATLAAQHGVPFLAAKGVADFADAFKDDRYRGFAARAAAECLILFLRARPPRQPATATDSAEPGERQPVTTRPTLELAPGLAPLPRTPSPAHLLQARHAVVPFAGRAEQLARLDAWADAAAPFRVLPLAGAGGMGKTRLLAEWARRRRETGWLAGFLRGPLDEGTIQAVQGATRAIVILDYAEGMATLGEALAAWQRHPFGAEVRVRVVLAARHLGDWWSVLRERSEALDALLSDADPVWVPPAAASVQERQIEWHRAVAAFAPLLPPSSRASLQPPDLSDPRYHRLLYLHADALLCLLDPEASHGNLLERVLGHEVRFWRRLVGQEDTPEPLWTETRTPLRLAVAALTLRGGVADGDALRELLGQVLPGVEVSAWAPLWRLFVRPPGSSSGWLSGLEPDLLGEALVREVLDERRTSRAYLTRVAAGATPQQLETMFTVLGRVEERAPERVRHGFEVLLAQELPQRAPAALRAVLTLGERTATSQLGTCVLAALEREGTEALARELEALLPERSVMLTGVAVWVTRRLLGAGAGSDAERARRLNNLGVLLSELGSREEALKATAKAVELYRSLARQHPDVSIPDLAASLNNLGGRLSELGFREGALKATTEAVELYRSLAQQRPDAFNPDLARSLNNLGVLLSSLGSREEALRATAEAVDLYRSLAQHRPDTFNPDLAASLNNLGVRLSGLGAREEALKATAEAVELRRVLAQHLPDAFNRDLAMSLNNLGGRLSELGSREEALKATLEASQLCRELQHRDPGWLLPGLFDRLLDFGEVFAASGRPEEALRASREAVELGERMLGHAVTVDRVRLVAARNGLAADLLAVEKGQDAHTAATQAVALCREWVAERPGADASALLARSLKTQAAALWWLERREEAVTAEREAEDLVPVAVAPTMELESIHIRNVKLVEDFVLKFGADGDGIRRWTVILGRNGLCKTTILHAIALAAAGSVHINELGREVAESFPPRSGEEAASPRIEARFRVEGRALISRVEMQSGNQNFKARSWWEDEGEGKGDPLSDARGEGKPLWFVAAYGVGRHLRFSDGRVAPPSRSELQLERLRSLFSADVPLRGVGFGDIFEPWRARAFRRFMRALTDRAEALLPELHGVHLREPGSVATADDLKYQQSVLQSLPGKREMKLPLTWLSHGYQASLAWMADLIGHALIDDPSLGKSSREFPDPRTLRGVVLVDELDLHLHPRWQATFIQALRETFPNLQFIATTHSPLLLSSLYPEEIVQLKLEERGGLAREEVRPDPRLMTGTELYGEFFGITETFPQELGALMSDYAFWARNPFRDDATDARVKEIRAELAAARVDPGFEPVERKASPRRSGSEGA